MIDEINDFDSILYGKMMPWLPENRNSEKYLSMLYQVKTVSQSFPFQFQVKFQRPFDHKTKYYSKFILNETINTINHFHGLISSNDCNHLKIYWLDRILEKKLKTRLQDIGNIIKERNFTSINLSQEKKSKEVDQDLLSNTHIIQLLKLCYMQIYLELQEAFKEWMAEIFIIDDFYNQLLFEPVPESQFLSRLKSASKAEPEKIPIAKRRSVVTSPQSFTYKQYNTAPHKLNDLCDSLKKNGFISEDTGLSDFKKIFSGSQVKKKIVWTGNISELYYFVKLIHSKHKVIEDLKQRQWEVACLCFVNQDGFPFERSKFRSLKKPRLTGEKIKRVVDLLL